MTDTVFLLGFKSGSEKTKAVLQKLMTILVQEARTEDTVPKKGPDGMDLRDAKGDLVYESPLKGGLMDLRNEENEDVFEYVIMNCFKTPITRQAWDLDGKLKCVSAFVTIYDEALIYLMLENNLLMWEEMSSRGVKSRECRNEPKYTSGRGKNVGWSPEGMKRFNAF